MTPDISVIIPLYNAKQYVLYTVDSLLAQTKKELEILLIDDCSTDGSPELVEERYHNDSRVRVIRQKANGGPGVARNTGIEQATGTYITFCDSDDQLKPECYEKMYAVAREWDADVVHATGCLISMMEQTPVDMLTVKDEDWCACTMDHPSVSEITLETEPQEVVFQKWTMHAYHWSVWSKLIRRSMLMENNIRFGRMRLAEDEEFCFQVLMSAKRYVMMPGFWYCYRQVTDSACRGDYTTGYLSKALIASFEAVKGMKELKSFPFFMEHPDKFHVATDIILEGLESFFIRPACLSIGTGKISASQEVRGVFEKYVGDQADWAMKIFCDAHANLVPEEDLLQMVNSPEGLRRQIEMGVFKTLAQVKQTEKKN